MSDVTIWHNPRCSKSRRTLALLEEAGITPLIRLYLKDAPGDAVLRQVHRLLGGPVLSMMRPGEPAFAQAGLSRDSPDNALFAAMVAHPILIERPVVIRGHRAIVARPPENVRTVF